MSDQFEFIIGENYENVKGVYEVISVDTENNSMVIRWESGEEIESSITLQERIIRRLEFEKTIEQDEKQKKTRYNLPSSFGSKFNGFVDSDFKDNIVGTTWRSREALGGAVSQLLFPKEFNFLSRAVYRLPMVQWSDVLHKEVTDANKQAKFYVQAYKNFLRYGFYIERSNESNDPKYDWNDFINWLERDDNEKGLKDLLENNNLSILLYESFSDKLVSDYLIESINGEWIKDKNPVNSLVSYLNNLSNEHWIEVYIFYEAEKETVISKKKQIVENIAEIFELLTPLYKASTEHLRKNSTNDDHE